MGISTAEDPESDRRPSRLSWLGGFLGVVIGLVALVVSWPSSEQRPSVETAFLGDAASSDDEAVITAVDAIQNLAGAYLDDCDAQLAADTIRILKPPRDQHEVYFRLFERYHKRLNADVERANNVKARPDERGSGFVDPDINVVPLEAAGTSSVLSTDQMLQQLSLLREFVMTCDDLRFKTRCLAKLAETRLDIDDAESPPIRKELVAAAKSLAPSMSQESNGQRQSSGRAIWQWLMMVALPLLTGLAGTAAVKLTEAFGAELGKTLHKVVTPVKEPPADKA